MNTFAGNCNRSKTMWSMFFLVVGYLSSASAFLPLSTTTKTTALTFGRTQRTSSLFVASDHFDMEELRQRIRQDSSPFDDTSAALKQKQNNVKKPERVYVILFHPGTPYQGAHTIEYPKGSGNNVILAFASPEACHKFAQALKEQNFFEPTPQEFGLKQLTSTCDQLGVFLQVVPEGVELIPPSQNVKTFGHDPHLKERKEYLEYLMDMHTVDDDDEDTATLLDNTYISSSLYDGNNKDADHDDGELLNAWQ